MFFSKATETCFAMFFYKFWFVSRIALSLLERLLFLCLSFLSLGAGVAYRSPPTLPKTRLIPSFIPFWREETEAVHLEKKRRLFMNCWKIQYIDWSSERKKKLNKGEGKNTKKEREKMRGLFSVQSLSSLRDDLIYCQMCSWIINILSQDTQSILTSSRAVVSEMFK